MDLPENSELLARIELRLRELNMSPRAASLKAGASPDLIRGLQRGVSKTLRQDHMLNLAKVLQVSESWLLGTSEDLGSTPNILRKPADVAYGGVVEAGSFRAQNDADQSAELRRVAFAPDPRYPAPAQAAFEVVGDSMDASPARIMPGMWVLAVERHAFERLHGDVTDGRLVVVARTRNGNPEQELTVKRLRMFRDRYELRPESHNPQHKALVFPWNAVQDAGQDVANQAADHVDIKAIVLQAAWLYG